MLRRLVKGTRTSHTDITKSLTITGHSNGGHKTATLNGSGQNSVLRNRLAAVQSGQASPWAGSSSDE